MAGLVAVTVAVLWYAQAQVRWFMHDLGISGGKALAVFIIALLVATVSALLVAIMISLDANNIAFGTA